MTTPEVPEAHLRRIRSFVRRPGRATTAQRRALETLLPRFAVADSGLLDLDALFGRRAPRVLDIGFGDGEALATSAANYGGLDYLGVEVHEPGVGHLLILLEQAALTNVRVSVRDAVDVLSGQLAAGAFAAVNVFFPDPWPKKRHHKRRLLQPDFVREVARVLEPGGLFHLATDWADYARHTHEVMEQSPRFAAVPAQDLTADRLAFRPPTKFERRGRRLGHDVVDFFYRSCGGSAVNP